MNELALFAGAGGGILGGHLLGWRTVCAVELDAYARNVLLQRQADGCLPRFPVWDDVRTFDGKPWRGHVRVVSGGFPCTDISSAGGRAGIEGKHSGLWREMARIIGEVEPEFAFVENASDLVVRGLDRVLGDLADLGFDARWGVVGASAAGLPHERKRTWIVAHAKSARLEKRRHRPSQGAGAHRSTEEPGSCGFTRRSSASPLATGLQWTAESVLLRSDHGVANRVDRMRCIGNGQVPAVAAMAWQLLTGGMNLHA